MNKLGFSLLLSRVLTACSPISDLAGTSWELSMYNESGDEPMVTLFPGDATFDFDGTDKIGGRSYCNIYGGIYSASNGVISIGELFSTEAGCNTNGEESFVLGVLTEAQTSDLSKSFAMHTN